MTDYIRRKQIRAWRFFEAGSAPAGRMIFFLAGAIAALLMFTGCSRPAPDMVQGYIEGDYVYVSSPYAGTLKTLHVRQGVQVKEGDILFTLENVTEKSAKDEAEWRLRQARENLQDAQKGKRSSEAVFDPETAVKLHPGQPVDVQFGP